MALAVSSRWREEGLDFLAGMCYNSNVVADVSRNSKIGLKIGPKTS